MKYIPSKINRWMLLNLPAAWLSGVRLTLINENKCEINFEIDFELNVYLFDYLMKKFFDMAFQRMVEAFINRAEEIY